MTAASWAYGSPPCVSPARARVAGRAFASTKHLGCKIGLEAQRRQTARFGSRQAEDGEIGLETIAKTRPDLILMDLSLPRIDGWEVTRRLKANPLVAHIPVIALSAHASGEDIARAKAAGCIDYLTKPVDRTTLVKTLRRHLQGPHSG